MTDFQCKLFDIIPMGEDSALHLRELVQIFDVPERELRLNIEQMRCGGKVILSSDKGYFKPVSEDEIRRFVRREFKRYSSIERRTMSARLLLREMREIREIQIQSAGE